MNTREAEAEGADFLARISRGEAFAAAPHGTVEFSEGVRGCCTAGRASVYKAKAPNPRSRAGRIAVIVGGILVLAIALASLVARTQGTSLPQLLEGAPAEPQTVEGRFAFSSFGAQLESDFVYTDAYFEAPASEYQASLATASCSLAVASSASAPGGEAASANVTGLLEAMGFDDVRVNEAYAAVPTPDSIGVAVGHKKLAGSGRELAAIAVRSGGYGAEWASNMDVGAGAEHAGFAKARDEAAKFFRSYLRERGLKPDAYWVSGFSRGGAVAGLLAQALVEAGAKAEAVYAYAFEPPASIRAGEASGDAEGSGARGSATAQASDASESGAHVFNVVNPADLVPRVPPEAWGYAHPGRVRELPSVGEAGYAQAETAMRVRLGAIDPQARYDVAAFESKRVKANGSVVPASQQQNQAEFLDSLTASIAGAGQGGLVDFSVPSAETYAIELQGGLAYLAEVFASESAETAAHVQEQVWEDLRNDPVTFAKSGIAGIAGFGAYEELADSYAAALDAAGIDYERDRLDDAVGEVADFLLGFALGNPDALATLLANAHTIAEAHSMVVELAWMQSLDPAFSR